MSTSFSTITPMNPATISRKPTYAMNNNQPQPAASSPMDAPAGQPAKKKSHWFLKTLGTVVVLAAAVGLGRKYLPNVFDPAAKLAGTENILQKGLYYAKLGVAKAGEFVNTYVGKAYDATKTFVTNLLNKNKPNNP